MSTRHRTLIAVGLLAAASTAGAQGRRPSTPVRQPQIGGIAPSPTANRPRDDRGDHGGRRDGDGDRGGRRDGDGDRDGRGRRDGYSLPSGAYGWVPAVVGRDGRVWVNLGYGYEPVVRACDVPFGGYVSGYTDAPSGYTTPGYSPPTYTPPTYSAPTYPAPSSAAISQPLPDPSSHPVPDPNAHPVPGLAPVPGVAPASGGRAGVAQYSYPPRDHRATASCYASGPQGVPAVLWH